MVYEGSAASETVFDVGGVLATLGQDDLLIAFEDLYLSNSDQDYQDLVAVVKGVRSPPPVPEPTAALVFGVGLLAVRFGMRRR